MYIAPNSKIYILKNVPLDPTYDHTIYWGTVTGDTPPYTASKAIQAQYFQSKYKYALNSQSYQRVKRGWMRVEILSDNLYDCNYLMFQNTSFGNKWFYAFIKSVEYINNNVSEIEFEIDDMQTWWFDYQLEQCFVEREHSATDDLFENIIDENVNLGESYKCNIHDSFDMNNMFVCVLSTRKPAESNVGYFSTLINNVYTPLHVNDCLPYTSFSNRIDIDDFLDTFVEDDIIAVYQYPRFLSENPRYVPPVFQTINAQTAENVYLNVSGQDPLTTSLIGKKFTLPNDTTVYTIGSVVPTTNSIIFTPSLKTDVAVGTTLTFEYYFSPQTPTIINKSLTNNFDSIDGYTPKNKKLFTYPYNFLMVCNNLGDNNIYHWEDFLYSPSEYPTFNFGIAGTYLTMPSVLCYPMNYKGLLNCYEEGITYNDFPQCAWTGDTFKAWYAQHANSFWIDALAGTGSAITSGAIASALTGGAATPAAIVGSAVSIAGSIFGAIGQYKDMQAAPNKTFGQTKLDSLNAGLGRTQFDFYYMSIKREYAEIIDSYFDRFGYSTRITKVPNRNVRPHWTYTKTIGCTINGSIPADSARKICDIYNAGITFWNNPTEVGNYSLDNSPVTS